MANYFDDQLIREIESKIDIVELISETVSLNRKGNRYWGLCPFHQEKTPSFSASREKQMYYCFGCHAGGNIFSYLMKRDGLEFREALELLAAKAGVDLAVNKSKKNQDLHKQMIAVNNAAAVFFQQQLQSDRGRPAREYLAQRGISQKTIEVFNLGYAPNEWQSLTDYLLRKGFSLELVKNSGLIKRNDNQERYYDLFRDRIIFPITQYNRDILGFGGRALGDAMPKYLNTAETDIYSKRRNLYGLTQAREEIRSRNEVILVEGYMDCIKLQQSGIINVVASLGTSLTDEQAALLHRYAEKAIVLYDGDEAGQRETMRAIEILRRQDLKVEVIVLPAGKDPDDFIEKYGKEGFLHYIQNNTYNHIEFKLNRFINTSDRLDLDAKTKIIAQLKEDINSLSSVVEQEYYIKILARKLRLEEIVVAREIQSGRTATARNKTGIIRDNNKYGKYGIQEKILAAMLNDENTFAKVQARIGINFFANPDYKTLANIFEQLQEGKEDKMHEMSRIAAEEGLEAIFARISMVMEEQNLEDREVEEFIKRVEIKKTEAAWSKVMKRIDALGESGDFNSALTFILSLDKVINANPEGGIKQ
jgi:DNA primase